MPQLTSSSAIFSSSRANRAYGSARKGTSYVPGGANDTEVQRHIPGLVQQPKTTVPSSMLHHATSTFTPTEALLTSLEQQQAPPLTPPRAAAPTRKEQQAEVEVAPPRESSAPPLADWACSTCTFLHEGRKASFLVCEICGSPRPLCGTISAAPTLSSDVGQNPTDFAPALRTEDIATHIAPAPAPQYAASAFETAPLAPAPAPQYAASSFETVPLAPVSAPVSSSRSSSPVSSASSEPSPRALPQDINHLLSELGIHNYLGLFEAEEVDLETLTLLSEQDLTDMGLPMGPRKKILLRLKHGVGF